MTIDKLFKDKKLGDAATSDESQKMDCNQFEELVFDYLDGMLKDEKTVEALENHSLGCDSCHKYIEIEEMLQSPKGKEMIQKAYVGSLLKEVDSYIAQNEKGKALETISQLFSDVPSYVNVDGAKERLLNRVEKETSYK